MTKPNIANLRIAHDKAQEAGEALGILSQCIEISHKHLVQIEAMMQGIGQIRRDIERRIHTDH